MTFPNTPSIQDSHPKHWPSTCHMLLFVSLILAFFSVAFAEGNLEFQPDYYTPQINHPTTDRVNRNVSVFVFLDIPRNGIYNPDDRSLANIAVSLTRADGSTVLRRTNQYGFANFTTSLNNPHADVSASGDYIFEIHLPNQWIATSNNSMQVVSFEANAHAGAGIVGSIMPQPIGIAPPLRYSGRVTRMELPEFDSNTGGMKVRLQLDSGDEREVSLDQNGTFSLDVADVASRLLVLDSDSNAIFERKIRGFGFPVAVSTVRTTQRTQTHGEVIEIIDFSEGMRSRISKKPLGPEGIEWTNLVITATDVYPGAGYINNSSGQYIGYNSSGYPVTVSRKEPFSFLGAFFGVAWPQAEGDTLNIQAWRDDELLASDEIELSALSPVWFDANYLNITRIRFSTMNYSRFVMDMPIVSFRKEFPDDSHP